MRNLLSLILIVLVALASCNKTEENIQPEKWQTTSLVNANLTTPGYLYSLDFYQKKGNEWRIIQFEPDDHIHFYMVDSLAPTEYTLPIKNEKAFMTSNVELFNIQEDKIYFPYKAKWYFGDPVLFNEKKSFSEQFPDLPTAWKNADKITTATYSRENAYDNNGKVPTYIFYDFPNQKYVYYAIKNGTDLVIEKDLSDLLPYSNLIDWTGIDAVTCNNSDANEDFYYFFDFDAQKMYVLSRTGKNTNKPKFELDPNNIVNLSESFFQKYITNQEKVAFDFSK